MNNETSNQTHPLITPDHLRRLAVIYIRQSSEQQVLNNVGSTELQRGLTAVARSYGWPESRIETIDQDLGITGSSSEGRAGWRRLQLMMAAGDVGAVFSVTISRLSRQLLDFELFRRIAAENNVIIYTKRCTGCPRNMNFRKRCAMGLPFSFLISVTYLMSCPFCAGAKASWTSITACVISSEKYFQTRSAKA